MGKLTVTGGETMNKQEMIDLIAKEAGITKVQAGKALNAMFDGITKSLKKGERVGFVGFGSWSVRTRKARTIKNPQTGEKMKIKARKVPVFKAGSKLKDTIAGKKKRK